MHIPAAVLVPVNCGGNGEGLIHAGCRSSPSSASSSFIRSGFSVSGCHGNGGCTAGVSGDARVLRRTAQLERETGPIKREDRGLFAPPAAPATSRCANPATHLLAPQPFLFLWHRNVKVSTLCFVRGRTARTGRPGSSRSHRRPQGNRKYD